MIWMEYLALGLELWTVVGLIGLTISIVRKERQKLVEGACALVGVWVIYLATLFAFSYRQPEERLKIGQPACFNKLCFTVQRAVEVPSAVRDNVRLLQVTVWVTNDRKDEAQEDVQGYLQDAQGRRWTPSVGVSGNPLNGRVLAGGTVVCEPVFWLAQDAKGLSFVLTHGPLSQRRLIIGDPESFGHRPRLTVLDR